MHNMEIREIPFQIKAVEDIINCYKLNDKARVLLCSPTGTGKTIIARNFIISENLRDVLLKDKERKTLRIIYKCHLERLLTQAKRRFDQQITREVSLNDWINQDSNPNTVVETVSTHKVEIVYQMYSDKIPSDIDLDLIIYAECHHEACNTIQEFLENAGKFPSLGMTATPDRNDNCLIKFDYLVEPITRHEAVAQGYICETDIRTIVDTSSKNKVELLKEILVEFHHQMKQTMIFVRTKKEIAEVTNFINNELGLKARGCDDNEDDIDVLLDDFGAREYQFLVSARKLGEGIDIPGVTDAIFAKNVGSLIDLNQYIGRVARTDVRECRIWEFVNCLASTNLDTQEVVGLPKSHLLINKVNGKFLVRDFM